MSGGAPRLWLVRHARPEIAPGLCYGRLDMPALAADSQAAAAALARALPRRLAGMRHSPLQRCELLAMALCGLRPDLASKPEPRIAELDFGRWEGQAWSALPRTELHAWAQQLYHYAPGGGEPLSAMLARVAAALQAAQQQAWEAGGDVVWLTHAGVARCAAWLLQHGPGAIPQAADWTLPAPDYGGWLCLPLPRSTDPGFTAGAGPGTPATAQSA